MMTGEFTNRSDVVFCGALDFSYLYTFKPTVMKVLVIFHVFYENLVGYYLDKMKNIDSCQWLASVDYYGDNHQKCLKLFGHVFELNRPRA